MRNFLERLAALFKGLSGAEAQEMAARSHFLKIAYNDRFRVYRHPLGEDRSLPSAYQLYTEQTHNRRLPHEEIGDSEVLMRSNNMLRRMQDRIEGVAGRYYVYDVTERVYDVTGRAPRYSQYDLTVKCEKPRILTPLSDGPPAVGSPPAAGYRLMFKFKLEWARPGDEKPLKTFNYSYDLFPEQDWWFGPSGAVPIPVGDDPGAIRGVFVSNGYQIFRGTTDPEEDAIDCANSGVDELLRKWFG